MASTNDSERTDFVCKECGQYTSRRHMSDQAARLRERQLCFECYFWQEKIEMADDPTIGPTCVRTSDGQHYLIGEEDTAGMRGFGGRPHVVRFFDGRVVETSNLWAQGGIDERFRDRLPPNATLEAGPLRGDKGGA